MRFFTAVVLSLVLSSGYALSATPSISRPSSSISRPNARSPSQEYTKPPTTNSAPAGTIGRPPPANQTPTGTIGRPGSNAPSGAQRPAALSTPRTSVDAAISRGASAQSLHAFDASQKQFQKPSIGAPQTKAAAAASPVWNRYGNNWRTSDSYWTARNSHINSLPPAYRTYWTSPPHYVVIARPAYGDYSGAFLGSLLGVGIAEIIINDSNARWAYAHHNDAAYTQWHADMMAQAQSDADVKARMDALDAKVTALQTQNVVVDPNQLPDNVDPSMVVAPETAMLATSDDSHSWGVWIGSGFGILLVGFLIYVMFFRSRRSFA